MKIAHIHVWDKKNKGDTAIVLAVQQILREHFKKSTIINFPVDILKKPQWSSLSQINTADIVIIGGGGIFYHWFTPYNTSFIKKIKPPLVVFGVGYIREFGAKRLSAEAKKSIAFLCSYASLVSVRDYYTKRFLTANGVPASKIRIIGDPAIFLKPKKCGFPTITQAPLRIGFNLNYSGWLGFGKYEKRILHAYETVVEKLQKKGAKLFYLMHHPDEARILKKTTLKNIMIINREPREQVFVYSQLNLVIGMMLHTAVLSFSVQTPFINIGYDIRNKNFARFIHCPELAIPVTSLSAKKLLQTTMKVLENEDAYRKKFLQRKNALWRKTYSLLLEINSIL